MSIRITHEIDGRIISLSPRYTVPAAAAVLHSCRAKYPTAGRYRVWRIKDQGARAVCIGDMPACYPVQTMTEDEIASLPPIGDPAIAPPAIAQ